MAKKPSKYKQDISPAPKVDVQPVFATYDKINNRTLWQIAFLVIICFVIYFRTNNYGYILDDQIVITDNSFTKAGFKGIYKLFTTESMTGYFGEQKNLVQGNRYRPLSLVTFAMEYGIFGKLKPGVSHMINLLLYALSCILIMRCVQIIIPSKEKIFNFIDLGFATALVFLIHPLHVEAVANIKGRDEILAVLFSFGALYYFALHFLFGAKKSFLYIGLTSYFLGLLSKENTITFAAVIPLTIWFFGGSNKSKAFNAFFWLLIASLVYLMLRFSVSGIPKIGQPINDIMNNPFLGMNKGEKFATIIYTLGLYIKLLFIPYPLTHDYYPYAIPIMNWTKWQVWLSLALYVFFIIYTYKALKSKSITGFAVFYYLITLTIVSNIIINLGTFMNDRFIYMASFGFCLILAWTVLNSGSKMKLFGSDYVKAALLLLPVIPFTLISYLRVPDWSSATALNESALKVSSNSARANSFMATAFFNEYKETKENEREKKIDLLKRAMPFAIKATTILPDYFNANLMEAGIAGEQYNMTKNLDSLLIHFHKVIERRPDVPFLTEYLKYLNGLHANDNKVLAFYLSTGKMLMAKKNLEKYKWAIHFMKLGLEVDPSNPDLNKAIGDCFTILGDTNQAAPYLMKASGM